MRARADVLPERSGLALQDVWCERGRRTLFGELDLRLAPGRLLRVQGPNGSGKTSLLRIICGLLAPSRGQVLWNGRKTAAMRDEFGRDLAFIGHAAALKDELSALENLAASLCLAGIAVGETAVLGALGQAGLSGRERVPVRTLSQGQRRRAALARLALSGSVPLWVLDEPFNALDAAATDWLIDLIAAHVLQGGIAVLTSHQSVALPQAVPQITLEL